jgi:potassium efflux system protein
MAHTKSQGKTNQKSNRPGQRLGVKLFGDQKVSVGQIIVRQGEAGDSLFIIVEGVVNVQVRLEDNNVIEVARLGAGSFFGEMALLTGQDRTATVIALNETYVFEIIKADILPLLQRQPEASKLISKVLTERQLMTKSKMGNLLQDPQIERDVIYKRMLRGIRDFFGLGNSEN